MRLINRYSLVIILSVCATYVWSQTITTPYSNYGIGEVHDLALPQNEAMGGLGISVPSRYGINSINPAWLTNNSLTSFQVGIKADLRNYKGARSSAENQTASIRYMAMSFPIVHNKWTSSVSLLPYSSVNYDVYSIKQVEGTNDSVYNQFKGTGGLSQLSWAHGITLFKRTNIGLRASYVFGAITHNTRNFLTGAGITTNYVVDYEEINNYSDFMFSVSLGQQFKIGDAKFINLGVVYDLPTTLHGLRQENLSRLTVDNRLITRLSLIQDEAVSYQAGQSIGAGLALENIGKFQYGIDFRYSQYDGSSITGNAIRPKNTLNFAVGGRIIPDYKDINSYMKRVSYRFGVNYKELPYVINESNINEFGINFGASFPVRGYSNLDSVFRFGWRGTTDNSLIRENFVQIVFGITINDRWFIKRRYD
ncbi:MAG: hypothetical protein OEY56_01410 [Cyclobacteriaceae bacterium]|nr:hypothetical protein [Cyclobacteriaceae bacterium]